MQIGLGGVGHEQQLVGGFLHQLDECLGGGAHRDGVATRTAPYRLDPLGVRAALKPVGYSAQVSGAQRIRHAAIFQRQADGADSLTKPRDRLGGAQRGERRPLDPNRS